MTNNEMTKIEADLLISGDFVLPFNEGKEILENGAVAVAGDGIVAVGKASDLEKKIEAKEELDANGCLIMPGLINLHTHAAMTCFRGLADDLPLQECSPPRQPMSAKKMSTGPLC
jgi:5-methylthioadenosine/S-adenosylhomocysteine deaminase